MAVAGMRALTRESVPVLRCGKRLKSLFLSEDENDALSSLGGGEKLLSALHRRCNTSWNRKQPQRHEHDYPHSKNYKFNTHPMSYIRSTLYIERATLLSTSVCPRGQGRFSQIYTTLDFVEIYFVPRR